MSVHRLVTISSRSRHDLVTISARSRHDLGTISAASRRCASCAERRARASRRRCLTCHALCMSRHSESRLGQSLAVPLLSTEPTNRCLRCSSRKRSAPGVAAPHRSSALRSQPPCPPAPPSPIALHVPLAPSCAAASYRCNLTRAESRARARGECGRARRDDGIPGAAFLIRQVSGARDLPNVAGVRRARPS